MCEAQIQKRVVTDIVLQAPRPVAAVVPRTSALAPPTGQHPPLAGVLASHAHVAASTGAVRGVAERRERADAEDAFGRQVGVVCARSLEVVRAQLSGGRGEGCDYT